VVEFYFPALTFFAVIIKEPPPPGKPGYSSCEEEKFVLHTTLAVK
jgi:hypothetical protein